MDRLLTDLFYAYYDARRHKRTKPTTLAFELSYESQLLHLYDALRDRTYTPGHSTAFIIHDPVQREIFAAQFSDRVIHHLIYNYIYDIFDSRFIHDSYSCRIGKGTHYGIQRVDHFIRACSESYTRDCYVLKLDIKGFFMHIDKHILWGRIQKRIAQKRDELVEQSIDVERLLWLVHTVLFHDPRVDVHLCGKRSDRVGLPDDKSLFCSPPDTGLPIGNLTSQLFANVYLHPLDTFIKRTLHCRYYGRYVDDFVLVHESKDYLISCITQIKDFLTDELHLTLHPHKLYLQHYAKGVRFLGAYIKPHRIYIHRRAVGNYKKRMHEWGRISGRMDYEQIQEKISIINSYLGMMQHYTSYALRKKLIRMIPPHISRYISLSRHYTKAQPLAKRMKRKALRRFISQYKHLYHALSGTSRL